MSINKKDVASILIFVALILAFVLPFFLPLK